MRNKEKYINDILESFANNTDNCSFRKNYILKKSRCNGISCEECNNMTKEWLEDEYQEPIKLTDDEIIILKNIDKKFKWIARDKCGILYTHVDKIKKDYYMANWINYEGYQDLKMYNHLFTSIKWENKEPYSIDELLKQNGVER